MGNQSLHTCVMGKKKPSFSGYYSSKRSRSSRRPYDLCGSSLQTEIFPSEWDEEAYETLMSGQMKT